MTFTIREATSPDYEGIAVIASQIYPEPSCAQNLLERDQDLQASGRVLLRRVVAVDSSDQVLAYGVMTKMLDSSRNSCYTWVGVHSAERRKGIGKTLYAHLEGLIREMGAEEISSRCQEEPTAYFEFATRLGFVEEHRRSEAVLDLSAWDGSRFQAHLERVRESGIRLESHFELPEALWPEVYACDIEATRDHPEYDGEDQSYENWKGMFQLRGRRRCWVLAWDGDRCVAMSIVELPSSQGDGAYTDYTCVCPGYRGRGLALAVKLPTVDAAIAAGAPHMRTNNNPENGPMLAVNRKLGYKAVPGEIGLKKTL